jgi:hypothetical protein
MRYQLLFHPEADEEYTNAVLWYEEKKKGLGGRFENMVEKCLKSISLNP